MATFASIPEIEFSDDELANVKESLGLPTVEVNKTTVEDHKPEKPLTKFRRNPFSRPAKTTTKSEEPPLPTIALTKRDEKEVNNRLRNILLGGTGILGQAKDYLAMTEEEASSIADPLSSYLVRNADTLPIARQVLENYDLAAITIGVASYAARVYHDRSEELQRYRANRATTLDRIHSVSGESETESQVWPSSFISNANASRNGT